MVAMPTSGATPSIVPRTSASTGPAGGWGSTRRLSSGPGSLNGIMIAEITKAAGVLTRPAERMLPIESGMTRLSMAA